jgi:hypothetical protein
MLSFSHVHKDTQYKNVHNINMALGVFDSKEKISSRSNLPIVERSRGNTIYSP